MDHGGRNHKLIFFSSQKNQWTRPLTKTKVAYCLQEKSCNYFVQSCISHYCRTRLQVGINHYQLIKRQQRETHNLILWFSIRKSPVTQAPLCFSQVTISQLPKWMLSKEGLRALNLLLAPPCESQTAEAYGRRRQMTTLNPQALVGQSAETV